MAFSVPFIAPYPGAYNEAADRLFAQNRREIRISPNVPVAIHNSPPRHPAAVDLWPFVGKSVAITGGTGLIGSHLARRIAQFVVAADAPVANSKMSGKSASTVRVFSSHHPFLCDQQFDFVIHAAGYGQPAKFMADPLGTLKVNAAGTLAMLSALKPGGKFLFLSSSEIYSGAKAPHTEDQIGTTDPSHPRSMYIEGKRCGEAIVNAARSKGVDAKSARVCLVYGPGVKLDDDRILSIMIRQALTEKRIVLRNSGQDLRCYCYIDDAVDMLLNVLLHGQKAVYNIGGSLGQPITIGELAARIALKTGTEAFVRLGETGMEGAPSDARIYITRYCDEFDCPKFTLLDEGLDRTIESFRSLIAAP